MQLKSNRRPISLDTRGKANVSLDTSSRSPKYQTSKNNRLETSLMKTVYNQEKKASVSLETRRVANASKLARIFNPITEKLPPTLRQSIVAHKKH